MNSFRKVIAGFVFAGFSLVSGSVAFSQTLMLPGTSAPGVGVSDSTFTFIDVSGPSAMISDTGSFTGEMASAVIAAGADPFNTLGGLTFVYQFHVDGSSSDAPIRLSINGFGGSAVALAYSTFLASTPIDVMTRSTSGNVVGASWNLGVAPGSYGQLTVYTDATGYSMATAFVQDGGQAQVAVFAPVPEPETYAMMLAGLGLMGFVARRRKQRVATA